MNAFLIELCSARRTHLVMIAADADDDVDDDDEIFRSGRMRTY
jgi:hypothetical protein